MNIENGRSNEMESLDEKLSQKTFVEKHIAEVQTREAPLRGAENPEQKRGSFFRWERGQILRAYKILRGEIRKAEKGGEENASEKKLLQKIRERAKVLEKNLDELERQCYENVKTVEIETKLGKFSVPVVELDLRKKEGQEPEKDKRTPYFLLGTVSSNPHDNVSLSIPLALDGERVLVPSWPEQTMVGRPENFGESLKQQKGLGFHKEYVEQTIRQMGLENVNLMGFSMGAAVAIELAQDKDFQEIQDLILMEPPGLEEKGLLGIARDFGIKEGLKSAPSAQARIKLFIKNTVSDRVSGLRQQDGRILGETHFTVEQLGQINPKGRYQLWVGSKSSIVDAKMAESVFLEAERFRQERNPKASPIEIHIVKGGNHDWVLKNNFGFAEMLRRKKPENQVATVEASDLEESGMAGILKDVK